MTINGWYFGPSYSTFNDVTLKAMLAGFLAPDSIKLTNASWIDALEAGAGTNTLAEPLSGYDAHAKFYAKSIVTKNAEPTSEDAWLSFWSFVVNKGQSISSIGSWYSIINL